MNAHDVKVAVLCGGVSAEREVSLRSGKAVLEALLGRGHHAERVEVAELDGLPQRLRPYSVVFSLLHGGEGEDGTVQLLLDLMGKPYVGSGPTASRRAMDKVSSHRLFEAHGISSPAWVSVSSRTVYDLEDAGVRALGLPAVVKPRREGSSIGVHVVEDEASLFAAVQHTVEEYGEALVEQFIVGREFTAAVLEVDGSPQVLPLVELRPTAREFFDYTAKYTRGECAFLCPAPLSEDVAQRAAEVALQAHLALGCRDLSRTDMRIDLDGTPFALEVNTLPGMTELSTFPLAAAAHGLSYGELVEGLLLSAQSRLPSHAGLG